MYGGILGKAMILKDEGRQERGKEEGRGMKVGCEMSE
jgi:hypothetical protein